MKGSVYSACTIFNFLTKIKSFSTLAIVFYPNTYFPCNTGNLIEINFWACFLIEFVGKQTHQGMFNISFKIVCINNSRNILFIEKWYSYANKFFSMVFCFFHSKSFPRMGKKQFELLASMIYTYKSIISKGRADSLIDICLFLHRTKMHFS